MTSGGLRVRKWEWTISLKKALSFALCVLESVFSQSTLLLGIFPVCIISKFQNQRCESSTSVLINHHMKPVRAHSCPRAHRTQLQSYTKTGLKLDYCHILLEKFWSVFKMGSLFQAFVISAAILSTTSLTVMERRNRFVEATVSATLTLCCRLAFLQVNVSARKSQCPRIKRMQSI